MKGFFAGLGPIILLFGAALGSAQQTPQPNDSRLLGAWECVSAAYNGQPRTASEREIKILSPHHFVFVTYDKDGKKVTAAGSGTWTLNGTSYVEHIEFLDAGQGGIEPTDATFTVSIDGNTMTQSGTVGTVKLKEVWKRLD